MSSSQQAKINAEIANLATLVGNIGNSDQKTWNSQNQINLEMLKDRDDFVERIEGVICSASKTHSENEQILQSANLRLQYKNSLSTVVNAITTRRVNPEIIPISSLRKSLNLNGTLYEKDILTAYSLGRIHNNIYRLNESLVFLVVFLHQCLKCIDFTNQSHYRNVRRTTTGKFSHIKDDARLLQYNNKSRIISIAGWTKEDYLVILEADSLKEQNETGYINSVPTPSGNHVSVDTLYGAWTVCNNEAKFRKWASIYNCSGVMYATPLGVPRLFFSHESAELELNKQSNYNRIPVNDPLRRLIDDQATDIENRSKMIEEYLYKLKNFVQMTKEGSSLLSTVLSNLSSLLPGSWTNTIKQVLLIGGVVIALPILFFLLILLCKCFNLIYCCYKPIMAALISSGRTGILLLSSGVSSIRNLASCAISRKVRIQKVNSDKAVHYRRITEDEVILQPKRDRVRASKKPAKIA